MIDTLFILEYCFDELEWEISACWSTLAKNQIISLRKCSIMIDTLFMLNNKYCIYSTLIRTLDGQKKN